MNALSLLVQAYDFTRELKRDAGVMLGEDFAEHHGALDALYEALGEYLYPNGPPPDKAIIDTTATTVKGELQ